MFLKRIELSGFKSFADPVVISFERPLTGIVGPNGCGKSNITDAVRWVLGEQSAKSLRSGSSLSDIIFAGSQTRRPVNTARVTLVFDNSQKIFDSPFEEIEITRQISRGSSEISNFINRTPVRLKDIQDLVMDTGLGRDSLSIISQGNISSFADARPEERRLLFEEAAGVAKYKKRKKISLSKLEHVHNNLERVQDLIDAAKEQLDRLEVQAEKALEYRQCQQELSRIEITVLVMQIRTLKKEQQQISLSLEQSAAQHLAGERALERAEEEMESLQSELFEVDGELFRLQSERSAAMEESMQLQKQKAVLDERRRADLNSEDLEARKKSLEGLFEEARYEYEDRRRRLGEAGLALNRARKDLEELEVRLEAARKQMLETNGALHSLHSRLAAVESRIANPPYRNQGVQAVMRQAAKLGGIHGLVKDLLECDERLLPAVSAALASAGEQIVVDSEQDARRAISWLKQSHAGRATFLPLSVCRKKELKPWQLQAVEGMKGILGTAASMVLCRPAYEVMRERLLGNILIASSLEEAGRAAGALGQSVKIVTLEGDVVHAGGAISGGSQKRPADPLPALKQEKAQLLEKKASLSRLLEEHSQACRRLEAKLKSAQEALLGRRVEQEKLANILAVKKEKFESLRVQVHESSKQEENPAASLVVRLSELHEKLDDLSGAISRLSLQKQQGTARQKELSASVRAGRRELSALLGSIQKKQLEKARVETRMEQDLLRLGSDYTLSYEAACSRLDPSVDTGSFDMEKAQQKVRELRRQMSRLGSVNLQAPEQLEEVRSRYSFLSSQKQELEEASRQILHAVDEMDQTMSVQFETMFHKINGCLEEVFQAMFGGGHARLVLCDPKDLLNTGVDVDVQPPGKSVKNLQTFSGGEKALIAISVLFAILKARTVPLCIFDEAEAALDQANVERFARYLSRFKDQSQFIAVTHRPGTMEQCDTLYGITMQQDGVSQVLKVLLKDAREM